MAYIYVLAAITAVLSVVVVALENKGILAIKYVLKTVASLCFVMIALLSIVRYRGGCCRILRRRACLLPDNPDGRDKACRLSRGR